MVRLKVISSPTKTRTWNISLEVRSYIPLTIGPICNKDKGFNLKNQRITRQNFLRR